MTKNRLLMSVVLPAFAAVSFIAGSWTVAATDRPAMRTDPAFPPLAAPWSDTIGGTGVVEPNTRTIRIATPLGGIISRVTASVGSAVHKGDELFAIDDRPFVAARDEARSDLAAAAAALVVATRQLALQAEVIVQRRAELDASEAEQQRTTSDFTRYRDLGSHGWSSQQRLEAATADKQRDSATVRKSAATLHQEVMRHEVLAAQVDQAAASRDRMEAALRSAQLDVDRSAVRAPMDGTVLQSDLRPGEYVAPGAELPIRFGNLSPLYVRASFDETNARRITPGLPVVARPRGGSGAAVPLVFVRFEPLMAAKSSLTNSGNEVVDTRVLQVIYSFGPKAMPAFVGEMVDVMADGEPAGASVGEPVGASLGQPANLAASR